MVVGILAILLMNTYDINQDKKVAISSIIGLLYAIFDEIHQSFVFGRTAMITDVIIDFIGILFGVLLVLVILNIIEKYRFTIDMSHQNIKNK